MLAALTTVLTYFLGAILIFLLGVYIFFKRAYTFWEKQNVPHIPGKYIFGSMINSTLLKTTLGEELARWYAEFKAKGEKFYGGYFFHIPFLAIIDEHLLRNIFSKDFSHFIDRGQYVDKENDPLTAHLFSLNGLEWKHLRQKLTPAFTSGKMKMMFQTLLDCTGELETCLDEFIKNDEPIDIKKPLSKYTINVIGSCAFGIDCNSFKNPNSEFVLLGEKAFTPTGFERIKFLTAITFPKIAKFFKTMITNKDIDRFFRNLVKDTIDYREKNNITRNDFMHLLIQLKNKGELEHSEDDEPTDKSETIGTTLTINEVAAQAFIFFLAGFETTSSTMTFCLYELSKRQDIQEKLREEIVSVLRKHDGKISYQSIKDMQYLERVVLETLRKHAPISILQREVTKDYQVPDTNLVLKKGLTIFIPVTAVHHDPEFYPNPEVFDPDRFTEENKATRPDFTFLPFGDGPRICIGLRFGIMQAKVGLCKLLTHYKFSLNPKTSEPLKFDPNNFVNAALGGIWLNAEKL